MSREVQALFSLLLIMATCAATGFAPVPPPPLLLNVPNTPGLLPPGIPSLLPPGIPGLFPPKTPDLSPPGIPGLLPPGIPSLLPPGIPGLFPPKSPGLFPPRIPGLLPPGIPSLLPPGIPGLRPPVDPAEIAKCWSSLQSIPGCAQEVITTIFTGKFALGPACCKAIVEVDEKCLPKLFPLFPSVSALLKNNCAQLNVAPPNPFGSKH